jgi:hypothetical protein
MAKKKNDRPPQNDENEIAPRRAGLRLDERDPDDPPGKPGSAGGPVNMAGTEAGGLASGGLGGTNQGDGSIDDVDLDDASGAGIYDHDGDVEEGGPPYAGRSGGAVGGTPAEKRSRGGRVHRGIAPQTEPGPADKDTPRKKPAGRPRRSH